MILENLKLRSPSIDNHLLSVFGLNNLPTNHTSHESVFTERIRYQKPKAGSTFNFNYLRGQKTNIHSFSFAVYRFLKISCIEKLLTKYKQSFKRPKVQKKMQTGIKI